MPLAAAAAPTESPRKARLGFVWAGLWGLLAVLHVTQGIWLSGGTAYPGDLGDGRFNQLVLEHGYQSLRGVYHWSSPSQFFPEKNTLGYSDTHAGTLPIYAVLRFAGLDLERAWQGWFVVVAALNVAAAFRLFDALGISGWLRGPLVFAAVASAISVWLAGTHMQMLPFFPILLGWTELVRWCDDRRPWRILAASGWLAWQFAAGPYLAFFGVAITLAVGAGRSVASFWVPLAADRTPRRPVKRGRAWVTAGAIALAGWGLAAAVAAVYATAIKSGAARSMGEVKSLAPDPASWFTASPAHAFYPAGWPGRQTDLVEHAWFAGFMPWLLLAAAAVVGWKKRRTPAGAWMLATAGGALVTLAFFTKFGTSGTGVWIAVADRFAALRAFRSGGRIAVLLQVVEVAAGGLLLVTWRAGAVGRWRIAPGVVAGLLVIEGLGAHQPVTPLALASRRANAMIAAWRAAGDRPVLAYAFGYTNQSDAWSQLDAWSAALRLRRATLNGYSGGIPGSHLRFSWNATVANARDLIASSGLSPDRVSIVEHFDSAADAALGIERQAQRAVQPLDDFQLQPFAWRLFAPLERYVIGGVTMYQFTPAAEVKFRLPDSVTEIGCLVGFRPDAYTLGGRTDGSGVTWLIQSPGQPEKKISYELLTPLTRPEDRGLLPRSLILPAGRDRTLVLRTDTGPAHNLAWDFLLVGRLRVK